MQAEHDQRPGPPAHATGAVEFVAIDDIALDETFRVRADGDVAQLATSMGRLGQLAPIELRPLPGMAASPLALSESPPLALSEVEGQSGAEHKPRWQVVAGFRRLAAVRLLARERVLARLHRDLSDHDAWGLALAEALLHEPLTSDELNRLRERLGASGVAPWAEELVDEALVRAPVAPELRERFHEFLNAAAVPSVCPEPAPPVSPEPVEGRTAEPRFDELSASGIEAPPVIVPEPPPAVLVPEPAFPEPPPAPVAEMAFSPDEIVEVTPEELVQDLTARLSALNQDLATAFEAWEDLPVDGRKLLVEQARYVVALLPFMEAKE